MQQRLALARPAHRVAWLAMLLDLCNVAANRFPALDLACVLLSHSAPHVVAAVPLEPAARIVGMNPAFLPPDRQWLTGVDAKVVERAIATGSRKPGTSEPGGRELVLTVRHVLAAEYTELEHFLRRELGAKFWIEIAPHLDAQNVSITALHPVIDCNFFRLDHHPPHGFLAHHVVGYFTGS